MKNWCLLFAIIALTLTCNISYAQNSILAGKIVDENNRPIPGARIIVSKERHLIQEIWADGDGLYYSKLLDEGSYHVDVVTDGKVLKAKKFFLDATPGRKKNYYIIRVLNDKVVIDKVDEDPSLKVKLGKIANSPHDIPTDNVFFIKVDSATGKPISILGPGGMPPKMK